MTRVTDERIGQITTLFCIHDGKLTGGKKGSGIEATVSLADWDTTDDVEGGVSG